MDETARQVRQKEHHYASQSACPLYFSGNFNLKCCDDRFTILFSSLHREYGTMKEGKKKESYESFGGNAEDQGCVVIVREKRAFRDSILSISSTLPVLSSNWHEELNETRAAYGSLCSYALPQQCNRYLEKPNNNNRKMSAVDERVAEKRKLEEKDTENGVAAKGAKVENGIIAVRFF
ncbi:unnamed protein product [Onchocerca flexuosa]|uniref:Uncharacterized protein n=1 Tax=Onchocerca flexuosa TaxID=387005 RepID=A0A183I4U6_9BILA|nr:unnamed protein product [Onchocerca flexuosa]